MRRRLLSKLDNSAQGWAAAISERRSPHDLAEPPGDPERAWAWRQLNDELDARNETSLDALQTRLTQLKGRLEQTTAALVDRRAWKAQIERTSLEQQKALMAFSQLIRRIGKGTGRRAPRLRLEAQRQLGKARTSVPVWIMPLSRVVDGFDPRGTRFDVVIIDEASQSDALALIALYLGKSVVIVGDHQQVTPEAVGVRIDEMQQLINAHLQGIPDRELYDGQQSIYDIGMRSFGGLISLREHFRCAPEIIQFSNGLSYDWTIRPLRDASSIMLKPHLVPVRVEGMKERNNVNEEEAQTVACLLAAAVGTGGIRREDVRNYIVTR